ncbi:MAG: sulfatase [Phycisphaeraceae bacterium]|nr:sulfatase [Phycisphaeraceae bacterium]
MQPWHNTFRLFSLAGLALVVTAAGSTPSFARELEGRSNRKPNVIVFLTDDQGYNDVGCFGSQKIKTPHIDRMAREGMMLTSFYVGSPVCGPSRAALMTGCYPIRIAEPQNKKNLHSIPHTEEIMLPELLRQAGYATGLIGKWHLAGGLKKGGDYPVPLMPNGQGFDTFYGTPLHNGTTATVTPKAFQVQIMRNDKVLVERLTQEGMDNLTGDYTQEAIRFMTEHKDEPFFLYLAHNMPHVPLGASKAFRGKSEGGLYGDVIEELDWSMGQILDTLNDLGLDEETLVVFTSDNGPWIEAYLQGYYGSAFPLRGSKMKSWEGGPRVPCIVRWPGHVPAGRICDEIATTMDILPTFAKLAGVSLPEDRGIDGKDIFPLISGRAKKGPHDRYLFYCYTHLQGVRSGRWKLVLPRPAKPGWMSWWARMIDEVKEVQLFDLDSDMGETTNLAQAHPEVVERLTALIQDAREELGDRDCIGRGARFYDSEPRRPDIKKYKTWLAKNAK